MQETVELFHDLRIPISTHETVKFVTGGRLAKVNPVTISESAKYESVRRDKNLRKGCDFPSHSRVGTTGDARQVPTCLFNERVAHRRQCLRETIDSAVIRYVNGTRFR